MKSIDVWFGRLPNSESIAADDWRLLDASERDKALRFKLPLLRARYAASHGHLRRILARYLDTAPEDIVIAADAYGKPFLPDRPERVFNLSHTAEYMAVAVGAGCRLGVDIETCRRRSDPEGIVDKCFGQEEIAYWYALSDAAKHREFFRFWTRKEAFVKASGYGISLGLERCIIDPCNPERMLSVPENCGPASNWHIADLHVAPGAACAVAYDNGQKEITLRNLDDETTAAV
ncbi:MAG: 4'-phosphopantetheinyl transferase family protein [Gammaproteobacteria bacterium]